MSEIDEVRKLIERQREKLYNIIIERKNIVDLQVLMVSMVLDKTIERYYNLMEKV